MLTTFVTLPNLLKRSRLLFIIDTLFKLSSEVEISINDPGGTFKSTFVDRMLLTRSISQSI